MIKRQYVILLLIQLALVKIECKDAIPTCSDQRSSRIQTYTLDVQFPAAQFSLPLLYRGKLIDHEYGTYIFKDIKKDEFTMFVGMLHQNDANTVEQLYSAPGMPYMVYTCKKRTRKGHATFSFDWYVSVYKGKGMVLIDLDALIIPLDPNCIAAYNKTSWTKNQFVTPLPTLILAADFNSTHIDYIKTLCALIDQRAFHAKKKMHSKHEKKSVCVREDYIV